METVVIFGGAGFVGSHIIRRIAKKGYKVIVPYQSQANEPKIRLLGSFGQITPFKYNNLDDESVIDSIKRADLIFNLKTLWKNKPISYEEGILNFNIRIIDYIKKYNENKKFIFFSGLGINNKLSSERANFIAKTENYIEKNLLNSIIIKPGVIIGGGDQFLKRLLPIFKFSPFVPIFGDGSSTLQPVYVDDVAKGIEKILNNKFSGNHIYELFGNEIYSYRDLYAYLSECLNTKRAFIPVPFRIASFGVYIIEKTPLNLITSEQLNLFKTDNLPSNDFKTFKDLKIYPKNIKDVIKKSIIK